MKKKIITCMALLYSMSVLSLVSAAEPEAGDVPADHWAYPAVKALMKDGIIDGYGNGAFLGDKTMTRYEMAQVVEKAMDNSNKANAKQKILIDKLTAEFALEINKIDVRVKKVEKAQQSTMKVGFDSMNFYVGDNPPAGVAKLQGNDSLRYRYRLYLSNQMNEQTSFDARLTTSVANFGARSTSTNNPLIAFDRAYFTSKNSFGFDSVIWGRQKIKELGGSVFFQTGNSDGVTLIKKLSNTTTFKTGAYIVRAQPTTGVDGNAQELQLASVTSKISPKLEVSGLFVNNNTSTAKADTYLNYAYDSSKIAGASAEYKMGKWTLMSEYDRASLDNPVNAKKNPYAYAFQITSGTVATNAFGSVNSTHCDLNKVGANALTVGYHYTEPGVTPQGFGGWNGLAMTSSKYLVNGKNPSGTDGTKGWLFEYQYVIAKGIQISADVSDLKYATTGAPLDKVYMLTVTTMF